MAEGGGSGTQLGRSGVAGGTVDIRSKTGNNLNKIPRFVIKQITARFISHAIQCHIPNCVFVILFRVCAVPFETIRGLWGPIHGRTCVLATVITPKFSPASLVAMKAA